MVSLFAKLRVQPGERAPKGEEIKVTLETDPGEGFEEDTRVELVDARLNAYQIETEDGRSISGISFKAMGSSPSWPGARSESDEHPGQRVIADVLVPGLLPTPPLDVQVAHPAEDRVVIGLHDRTHGSGALTLFLDRAALATADDDLTGYRPDRS